MIAYTWVFPQIDVAPSEDGLVNVAKQVHWRLDAVDGEYTSGGYGTAALPAPNEEDFVPYEQITEAMVEAWVTEALGGEEGVDKIKAAIAVQIENQKNPPIVPMTPPWAQE